MRARSVEVTWRSGELGQRGFRIETAIGLGPERRWASLQDLEFFYLQREEIRKISNFIRSLGGARKTPLSFRPRMLTADSMPSPMESHLSAIVVADVAGYSGLMALNEVSTIQALVRRREIFAGAIASFQGRIVNVAGDSIL